VAQEYSDAGQYARWAITTHDALRDWRFDGRAAAVDLQYDRNLEGGS
jgi:hypothetical protein